MDFHNDFMRAGGFLFSPNEKRKTERKWVNEKLIYSRITEKKKTIRQNIYKRKYDDWSEQKSLHLQNIHKSDCYYYDNFLLFALGKIHWNDWKNAQHRSVTFALILNVLFTKETKQTNFYWIRFMICNYSNVCVCMCIRCWTKIKHIWAWSNMKLPTL